MARLHRMTPRRRAALRKAQLASARKRKRGNAGRAFNRRKNRISPRNRQRIKTAAMVGAVVAVHVAANSAKGQKHYRRAASRSRARNNVRANRVVSRHTGTSPRVVHGARVAGSGPNSANRIFVGTTRGTVSVRRRIH